MKNRNYLVTKVFDILILIIILCFVGYVINKVSLNNQSVYDDSSTLKIEVKYSDLKSDDSNNVILTKELEEKLDDYIKGRMLSYGNLEAAKIDNIISVTSIFFTVLVVIVTLFQYLKGKTYEQKLYEYDAKINEYSKHLEKSKEKYMQVLTSYNNNMKLLVNINSSYIKAINYTANKNYNMAVKEYEKLQEVSKENKNVLKTLELNDLYTNISFSYFKLGLYDKAIKCICNILDIENKNFMDKKYLKLYVWYCKVLVKKAIETNTIKNYNEVIERIKELENFNADCINLEYDDILLDINFNSIYSRIYIGMGKLLFGSNEFGNAKRYLEEGLNILKESGESDLEARVEINKIYLSNKEAMKINFKKFFNNYNCIVEQIGEEIYDACDCRGYVNSAKEKEYIYIKDKKIIEEILEEYIRTLKIHKVESVFFKDILRKIYLVYSVNQDLFIDEEDKLKPYREQINSIINADCRVEHSLGKNPFDEKIYEDII